MTYSPTPLQPSGIGMRAARKPQCPRVAVCEFARDLQDQTAQAGAPVLARMHGEDTDGKNLLVFSYSADGVFAGEATPIEAWNSDAGADNGIDLCASAIYDGVGGAEMRRTVSAARRRTAPKPRSSSCFSCSLGSRCGARSSAVLSRPAVGRISITDHKPLRAAIHAAYLAHLFGLFVAIANACAARRLLRTPPFRVLVSDEAPPLAMTRRARRRRGRRGLGGRDP
ncbi:hypothetical protein PsYK624_054680 [Phanerochaete sordida]|uniref:Uncharacterized protein n=1 Tax=Phanerochaete sordida TaxID=48140 RepID=A0A9P3G7Q9_9APHY|nr:hypothetical protein PsYK624_054680 [Phanerochaete sordida]